MQKGLLLSVKRKKGVFRRADLPPVDHQAEGQTIDCLNKDRTELFRKYKDELGEAGQFLEIPMPLGLDGHLKLHKGSTAMIAGVTSTAKTIKGMQWAAALRDRMKLYYFQRELSKGERADRRSNLEAHLNLHTGRSGDHRAKKNVQPRHPGELG